MLNKYENFNILKPANVGIGDAHYDTMPLVGWNLRMGQTTRSYKGLVKEIIDGKQNHRKHAEKSICVYERPQEEDT